MPWQVLILVNVLLASFRTVQSGRMGRYPKDLTLYAMALSFLAQFCVAVVMVLFDSRPVDHGMAWDARYFLFLGGALYTTLNIVFLTLFRILPASIVAIVSLLNPLSVVIVATTFSGEALSLFQWAGSTVILSAVLLSVFVTSRHAHPQSTHKKTLNSKIKIISAFLALSVATMFGFAVVNEKYLIDRLGLTTYFLYGIGFQILLASVYILIFRKKVTLRLPLRVHSIVWIYAFLLALSGLFFILTLESSDSSSLTAVGSSAKVALSLVLAYIILKEKKDIILKICAFILSLVGLFLLFS